MRRTVTLTILFVFVLSAQLSWAQIPEKMSYQGLLTDASGNPVADGSYSLTFRLYDHETLGSPLWTETHSAVTVKSGIFSVILGAGTPPVPLALPFDQQYWLGVRIGTGPELIPRIRFTSSAYSLNARTVANGTVTTSKLADDAVTGPKLADNVVSTTHILGATIIGDDIANGVLVRSINLLRDDVTLAAGANVTITPSGNTLTISATGAELPDGAVTTSKLADAAVTTSKLAGNAATTAKIQPDIVSSVDGVSNDGGNVDLVPQNAITVTPNDSANTIAIGESHSARTDNPHSATAAQTGALVSVDGVSNAGGNIDLVQGANVTITPNDTANTITISASGGSAGWSLTGNAGTNPTTNFLGTTDNKALELRVNGLRALLLSPHATSPNLIGGYSGNSVTTGVYGATISGGGSTGGNVNKVTGNYGTVGGGRGNEVTAAFGTIAGGGMYDGYPDSGNKVTDEYGTVSGGGQNTAGDGLGTTSDAYCATVGGGWDNAAMDKYDTVAGGTENLANGPYATVGGGYNNKATMHAATVGGGQDNDALARWGTIGGGESNSSFAEHSTIGGGKGNYGGTAVASYTTIGGGQNNTASGDCAVIAGGCSSSASASYSAVCGGSSNTASGAYSIVLGGFGNTAAGDHSIAGGAHARAEHFGAFVWGDGSTEAEVASAHDNQFLIRASGGTWLHSDPELTSGVRLTGGSSTMATISDRNMKANIRQVDAREILAGLSRIPICRWNYRTQDPSIEHIGPMAQDFYAAFGLDEDDRHISTVDADGVALAAIQGLYELLQEKDAKIAELEARLKALEESVSPFNQSQSE